VGLAVAPNVFAFGIVTDEPNSFKGEGGFEVGQIDQHIIWSTSIAGALGQDSCESILRRVAIDDLGVIDDPVSAS
jgi:hypothetical protein